MSRVQRKIEDRSGASLSVALLFFLVCAIVGSILIAAASVSMGRMKDIEKGEQERYAVDSAMELIAEKLGNGEVTFAASTNRNDVKETIKYKKELKYGDIIKEKNNYIFYASGIRYNNIKNEEKNNLDNKTIFIPSNSNIKKKNK